MWRSYVASIGIAYLKVAKKKDAKKYKKYDTKFMLCTPWEISPICIFIYIAYANIHMHTQTHIHTDTDTNTDGWNFSGRTEHEFLSYFFAFLSTYMGNLQVCYTKTFDIFGKYMSATSSTYLCFDHSSIGACSTAHAFYPPSKNSWASKHYLQLIFASFCSF